MRSFLSGKLSIKDLSCSETIYLLYALQKENESTLAQYLKDKETSNINFAK